LRNNLKGLDITPTSWVLFSGPSKSRGPLSAHPEKLTNGPERQVLVLDRPRVLIVEDEALVGQEIKAALQDIGCLVIAVVPSGEEALTKLKHSPADLVLMDIVLRGKMDGIEAAKIIRRRWGTPVAYITAFADNSVRELALMTNPVAVLYKPVTREQLRQLLYLAYPPGKEAPSEPFQPNLWSS
jgi:CheY-like chemotaxis protein